MIQNLWDRSNVNESMLHFSFAVTLIAFIWQIAALMYTRNFQCRQEF